MINRPVPKPQQPSRIEFRNPPKPPQIAFRSPLGAAVRALATVGLGLTLAATGMLAGPRSAQACGGLFCDQSQPVNQAAEQIIFAKHDDGTVSAVVRILYEGPSERFAWLLPVPGEPEIGVSSDLAFARLRAATDPSYQLQTDVEGACAPDDPLVATSGGGFADAGLSAAQDGGSAVNVVNEGTVGPYDYVLISVDKGTAEISDAAIDWLQTNNYDVPDASRGTLGPYLEAGMNLLAFRLTKGNDAGAIRPVRMRFSSERPMIPIRPTALAANDDMGVLVWVLGESRAVPVNYRALELNEALINWFAPGSTYNDVVIAAGNEAGGQGFVTEMSGSSETFNNVILSSGETERWAEIKNKAETNPDGALIVEVIETFLNYDGLREALEAHVPLPSGVTVDEALFDPYSHFGELTSPIDGFDRPAFLEAIEDGVIAPLADTQALFDGLAHVTRLYTTLSAAEMTVDPLFDFNPQLDDVPNVHSARRVIECNPSVSQFDAPWRVELPQGDTVRGQGNSWPLSTGFGQPVNRRVLQLSTTGEGEVITDNAQAIQQALTAHNATVPRGDSMGAGAGAGGGGGCALSSGGAATHKTSAPATGLACLSLLALLVARRRRARNPSAPKRCLRNRQRGQGTQDA